MAHSDLRLKELCRDRKITQAKLAEKLGISPISFSQAVNRNNFDMNYLKRIAAALDVSVCDLFREENPPSSSFKCPHCGKHISIHLEKE